jgi:hypothetical protein
MTDEREPWKDAVVLLPTGNWNPELARRVAEQTKKNVARRFGKMVGIAGTGRKYNRPVDETRLRTLALQVADDVEKNVSTSSQILREFADSTLCLLERCRNLRSEIKGELTHIESLEAHIELLEKQTGHAYLKE